MTNLETYLAWLKASGEIHELSDDHRFVTVRSSDNEGASPKACVTLCFDLRGGYICTRPWRDGPTGEPLTARQAELLAFWGAYREGHGVWPTMREAGEAMGISKVTVYGMLRELEAKNYMRAAPWKQRRAWAVI